MKHIFQGKWILVWAIVTGSIMLSWMSPVVSTPGPGDVPEVSETEFSFIRYNLNKLEVPVRNDNWTTLFDKMESIAFHGKGKVSVVHIGGSHVQAGFLTDRLRENFTGMLYGARGERGFVYPFAMAGTNSPHSIKAAWTGKWEGARSSKYSDNMLWGVSGISSTTRDAQASVRIETFDAEMRPYEFSRVRIYNQRSENVEIIPDSTVTVTRFEDFPEWSYVEIDFFPVKTELNFRIQRTDSQNSFFTFQGVYLGNDDNGITYNAIGVNGANAMSYTRGDKFQEQLNTLHPDLAVFGIGVNDANVPNGAFNADLYYERLEKMIEAFRKANPDVCFVFITNNDTYFKKRTPNKNIFEVQQVLYRLADKYNGAVYDMFEIMGGLGSIRDWQLADLASADKIHLSRKGYQLQADMMTRALQEAFGNYLNSKNNY